MRKIYALLSFIGIMLILLVMPARQVYASHAMGADITYTCLGNNQYQVTVAFYRDCAGISAPSSIIMEAFSNSCGVSPMTFTLTQSPSCPGTPGGSSSGTEVSPLCPSQVGNSSCSNGSLPGVQVYYYCSTITLPQSCPDWIIGYGECCRNDLITNLVSASTYDQYVYATINNQNGLCNNSPTFTNLPVPYFCAGIDIFYNHGTVDIDGDSLVYSLIQPLDDYGVMIPYNGSFTPSVPMTTTSGTFGFDPLTGQMSFNAANQQVSVITVLVQEYRNGVLIGTTMRDIQVVILNPLYCSQPPNQGIDINNLSGGGLLDSTTLQMCPNTTINFNVYATDPDQDNITMTSNAGSAIPSATFSVSGNNTPNAIGSFSWTPTTADTGFNTFVVNVQDNGCPFQQSTSLSYKIYVFDEVIAQPAMDVYCNNPIQLYALGGTNFVWTPTAGLSDPSTPNPTASPSVSTMYYVTSDCGLDSVYISVQPDFYLDVGTDTAVCLGSSVQLNAVADPQYAPYTYSWGPNVLTSNISNPAIGNPLVTPQVNTNYVVTATSALGCVNTDTVTVGIQGANPNVRAYAEPDSVCYGGYTTLSTAIIPLSCGASSTPCNNTSDTYDLGQAQTSGSNFSYPSVYGNYYEGARHQILYRASELNAMGLVGGTITEIGFNIAQVYGYSVYYGFTIKMGCTGLNSISAFQSGLTTVLNPQPVNLSTGWNMYTLGTPYNWDGVSNLVVEVCFNNGDWIGNSPSYYSTTSFTSVVYHRADNASVCTTSTVDGISSQRPNTRFGICQQVLPNATYSWSPSANLDDPNSATPTAQMFGPITYSVDVSDNGCVGSTSVTIEMDYSLQVDAVPDTALCVPGVVQLNAIPNRPPDTPALPCGINGTACTGPSTHVVGNFASISSNPTPYYGSFADARIQMLFRASELNAVGITGGTINAIAFNIGLKQTLSAFPDYTISMGCTSANALSGNFLSGANVVYTPKNTSTVLGWNTLTLDNPYDWDGTSNLLIDICFNNTDFAYLGDDAVYSTVTPFTSVLYAAADLGSGCMLNNTALVFNASPFRPDVRFSVCPPPPGSYAYTWSPVSQLSDPNIQNPVASATGSVSYVVSMTDGACIALDTVTIDFYNGYDPNAIAINLNCSNGNDGMITTAPTGTYTPFNFDWSTGKSIIGELSDTLFNLAPGTYYLTVTDANGCVEVDTAIIPFPTGLSMSLSAMDAECYGLPAGSASVSVTNGQAPYTYVWSNGDSTAGISGLIAGTYTLSLYDGGGCLIVDSIVVNEPDDVTTSLSTTAASCYGYKDGSATIQITGGGTPPFTYVWENSTTMATASGLGAGYYSVTATDVSGCYIVDSVMVSQPDSFSVIISTLDASCFLSTDGAATASVQGDTVNYSFVWQTNPVQYNATATGLSPGTVWVEVTDTGGCSIPYTAIINSPPAILLTATITDVSCFGESDGGLQASVSSGGVVPFNYSWSSGQASSIISGLSTGDYVLTVTDASSCKGVDTFSVKQPAALSINPTIQNISCFGDTDGSIKASVDGGTAPYYYSWGGGNTLTGTGLSAGNYDLTITDANGCMDSISGLQIMEPGQLLIGSISLQDAQCGNSNDGAIFVSGAGGTPQYQYTVGGNSLSQGNFNALAPGEYDVIVTDANGCIADTIIIISAPDSLIVEFIPDRSELALGEELTLSAGITPADYGSYAYSWSPSTGLSCTDCPNPVASPELTTVYELTVVDSNGCPYSDLYTVEVDNELILYVPTAFTPNGDGVNDEFNIYGISIVERTLKVFNKWGEKVFESTDPMLGWKGNFKGKPAQGGVYVYYVEATYSDGQKKAQKGSVTLLR